MTVKMQRNMCAANTDMAVLNSGGMSQRIDSNATALVSPTAALSSAFGYVLGDIVAQIISRRVSGLICSWTIVYQ